MNIQQRLDDWLASNPEAQKYVDKLYYVPEGATPPADVTHLMRLTSVQAAERALRIGAVVKPQFAVALDAFLALIATQPHA